jgi:hypothetical protein
MAKKTIIIGLVDADLLNGGTRHPNLALMKIAGFLLDNNINFELITDTDADINKYKYVYISKVFTFTPNPNFYTRSCSKRKFKIGGTGYYATETSVKVFTSKRQGDMEQLEKDEFLLHYPNKYNCDSITQGINMARQKPFYDLYEEYIKSKIAEGRKESYYNDYRYFSIGFLTRGCFRHCPFCVNKLENTILPYSQIEWFIDDDRDENGKLKRPYIYLWDDNFLASKPEVWRPLLQALQNTGRPFQFRQGLDERILAESEYCEEIAETLSKCRYYGDYIFAFDNWRDRSKIVKALKIWKFWNPKRETKFYLFCGYKMRDGDDAHFYTDIWELFQRIKILMQYGCFGYVMRHEDYKNHELCNIYVQIARWCNQPQFFRYMSFWEYCYRNQSFWEQNTRKLDVPNQISYEEFERRYSEGYYKRDGMKLCKTMRSFVDLLAKYPDHKEELLEMSHYKLKELVNPHLWERI